MGMPAGLDPKHAHVVAQWPADGRWSAAGSSPGDDSSSAGSRARRSSGSRLADGKKVAFPGGHDSWVFALAFSPDGRTTYSGGGDGRVVVWDTEAAAPKPIRTIDAHRGWVRALGVSLDGKLIASGGNDRAVRLWDAATGRLVHELTGHLNHIYSLEFLCRWEDLAQRRPAGLDPAVGPRLGQGDRRLRREGPAHLRRWAAG